MQPPAQSRFAAIPSQKAKRATTLLAEVADLERGERIKELRLAKSRREGRRISQMKAANEVGVSYRAYQLWEAGGGIKDANVGPLATFLESDEDYILRGPSAAETPDLMGSMNGPLSLDQRLAGVEAALADANEKLDRLLIAAGEDDAAVEELARGAREAGRGLERESRGTGGDEDAPATAETGRQ